MKLHPLSSCALSLLISLNDFASAQEAAAPATLKPGENLLVQGIPAIPATIAEQANRYTEFRSAAVFSWHPHRREMLIGTRFADTAQIHEVKMPGGARSEEHTSELQSRLHLVCRLLLEKKKNKS